MEGLDDAAFDRGWSVRWWRFAGIREHRFPGPSDDACGRNLRSEREVRAEFHRLAPACGEACALLLRVGLLFGLARELVRGVRGPVERVVRDLFGHVFGVRLELVFGDDGLDHGLGLLVLGLRRGDRV